MMNEYDFFKCMNIHKRLKQYIKGHIFITLQDRTMKVCINAPRHIHYEKEIDDIPYRINFDSYTEDILNDYRDYLRKKVYEDMNRTYFISNDISYIGGIF